MIARGNRLAICVHSCHKYVRRCRKCGQGKCYGWVANNRLKLARAARSRPADSAGVRTPQLSRSVRPTTVKVKIDT